MSLTLAEANKAIEGAIAKGGRLVAFSRMDGTVWGSVYGSQGKAVASVGFGRASGLLQDRADSPIIRGIVGAEGGHMIPSQGAVPIVRDGVVVGACGVGGGTGEEDEVCARAGVDCIGG